MTEARAIATALAVWLGIVRHGTSSTGRPDGPPSLTDASYLLDQVAKGARGEAARAALWRAISTGTAQPALAGLLKASLLDALRGQLQPASSGGAGMALALLGNLLSWHDSSTSCAAGGLTRDWQPVATTLLGWAPQAVIDRLNQLSALPQGASRRLLLIDVWSFAKAAIDLAVLVVGGGAGDWLQPATLVEALNAWLRTFYYLQRLCNGEDVATIGTLHTSIYRLCATTFLGSDWQPRQGGGLVELASKDENLALDVLGAAERELGYWRDFAVSDGGDIKDTEAVTALALLTCPAFSSSTLKVFEVKPDLVPGAVDGAAGLLTLAWKCLTVSSSASSASPDSVRDGSKVSHASGSSSSSDILKDHAALVAKAVWRLCSLLLTFQLQLVAADLPDAQHMQQAAYVGLPAVHAVLQEFVAAPCSQQASRVAVAGSCSHLHPELGEWWSVGVACRGAFECVVGVLAADRHPPSPKPGDRPPAFSAACRVDLLQLVPTLDVLMWHLGRAYSPLMGRLLAAALQSASQEPGLRGSYQRGAQVAALDAEWAVLRVLLAHASYLDEAVSGPASFHGDLTSIWALLLKLTRVQGQALVQQVSDISCGPSELAYLVPVHMTILTSVGHTLEGIAHRSKAQQGSGEASQSVAAPTKWEAKAAVFQVLATLQASLAVLAPAVEAPLLQTDSWHQSLVAGSAQHLRSTIRLLLSCSSLSSVELVLQAGFSQVLAEALRQLLVTINGCCKPAAWQLTGPDDALDVLLPASGSRAAGVYVLVASGSFLAELAEWVVLTLGRLLQSSEGDAPILDPEYGPAFQRLQIRAGQLVRECCQATDAEAGTKFAAVEREITARSSARLRTLLSEGKSLRIATLEAARQAWEQRLEQLLPCLNHALRSAQVAVNKLSARTLHGSSVGSSSSSKDGSSTSKTQAGDATHTREPGQLISVVLQRELSCTILGCENPLCAGLAAAWGKEPEYRRCAGCTAVRYCSEVCAKADWKRHRSCCLAFKRLRYMGESASSQPQ